MAGPIRIAMWSGPRNLSTAMMRSFGNRTDCAVTDEPFYAVHLEETGIPHPMREEVLAAMERDPARIAQALAGRVPGDKPIWYQKHMVHHMTSAPRDWFPACRHAILLRHPARVIASYAKEYEALTAEDVGFPALASVRDSIVDLTGQEPPIVEAEDIRSAPEPLLRSLCEALGISFDPAMLRWPPGKRESDGVWAPVWYASVERSTGFAAPDPDLPPVSEAYRAVYDEVLPIYEAFRARKLGPGQ